MAPTNVLSDVDTRFAHLLNPIRDLTKNWNIDIAADLELYLAELEHVTISFDDGKTTMNFAQAALLIQGTTSVYSKKVEFLYNLVMQMLELLHSKRKTQQGSSVDADGNDKDAESLQRVEDQEEWLSLDDIEVLNNNQQKDDRASKKKSALQMLPKTPTCLLPVDDSEKGDTSMYTISGELIGNKSDFKINISETMANGMLTLDMSILRLFEELNANNNITPSAWRSNPLASSPMDDEPPPVYDPEVLDDGPCHDDGLPVNEPESPLPPIPLEEPPVQLPEPVKESKYNLRRKSIKEDIQPIKKEIPPIKLLDPYDENPKKDVPFKKGKIPKLLVELLKKKNAKEDKKDTKRRKNSEEVDTVLETIAYVCSQDYVSEAMNLPKHPLKALSFPEFEAKYWEECKTREAILRKQKASAKDKSKALSLEPMRLDNDDDDDANDIDKDGYEPFAAGEGGPLEDDFGDELFEKQDCCDPVAAEAVIATTYEDLVRNHVDNYLQSAQHHAQLTDLALRVNEWEEKIVPLLEEEEVRGPFDIHQYGSKVLAAYADNNRKQTLKFAQIVAGKQPYEVARYFLSTLQLANSYNVGISSDGELEKGMDTMEVTLLSRKRHHEELEEYVAPSTSTQHRD